MSVNSSSLLHPHSSSEDKTMYCMTTSPSYLIIVSLNIIYILVLLPLCTFILHRGLHPWWQKRSTSSAVTVSHSDCITFHMVTMELIRVFGCGLLSYGTFKMDANIVGVGSHVFSFTWFGETFFHNLTCVERYLAVVHPVMYLTLRKERGVRVRNISIACVWLFCFVATGLNVMDFLLILNFCCLILSLIIVSFCSLSVLCVLIRPGPGERGGDRERVDQSKLRAFYTITAILGMLMGRCVCRLAWAVSKHYLPKGTGMCVTLICKMLFNLSSSLVLPVLFLHRAGRLACCK